MAGGMVVTNVGGRAAEYNGKVTAYVVSLSALPQSCSNAHPIKLVGARLVSERGSVIHFVCTLR